MNRRGFALLSVLWMLTVLSAITATAVEAAHWEIAVSHNRVLLERAGWAREACLEILLAEHDTSPQGRGGTQGVSLDSIDLGGEVWCRAAVVDPQAQLNINSAPSTLLRAIVGSDTLTTWLIRGRPWVATEALQEALPPDPVRLARALPFLTVRGSGAVNLNSAPREVLATLPGVSPSLAAEICRARTQSPIRSLDALLRLPGGEGIAQAYATLLPLTVTEAPLLIAFIEGHANGGPLTSRAVVTLAPVVGRWAVLQRETT
jgi:type II secretory pathway component PulK